MFVIVVFFDSGSFCGLFVGGSFQKSKCWMRGGLQSCISRETSGVVLPVEKFHPILQNHQGNCGFP